MQTLLFCAIYNLDVPEINDEGIKLPFDINITTDNVFKSKLISKFAEKSIGSIEYDFLFRAPIFYSIQALIATGDNADDVLCNFLSHCKIILFDMWRIKDHAVDLQMGYLYYPYKVQSNLIITPGSIPHGTLIHSNLITTSASTCLGQKDFTRFEIDEIKSLMQYDEYRVTESFAEREQRQTQISSSEQKIALAGIFVQQARGTNDLAIKISLYCTAFECLFTTDTKELSHKTAERAALLIGQDMEGKEDIYKKVKNIYNIRSQVLHGSAVGKKEHNRLSEISANCDNLLRQILKKIDDSPELDVFYRKHKINAGKGPENPGTLDDYFLKLLFE